MDTNLVKLNAIKNQIMPLGNIDSKIKEIIKKNTKRTFYSK